MLSHLRAVFFDVDFTLIYPGPMFQGEGYRDFCSKHGVANCDPSAFHAAVASASALLDEAEDHAFDAQVFVRYIRHIIERMGGSGEALDACALEIYREWAACHHFSLYDDVLPSLQALRAKGLLIGLISNTHRSLENFQSHFELDDLIAGAVSSREHGYNKPHPSIFRTALRLLPVAPGEALMVGDSFGHDIEGCARRRDARRLAEAGKRTARHRRSRPRHRDPRHLDPAGAARASPARRQVGARGRLTRAIVLSGCVECGSARSTRIESLQCAPHPECGSGRPEPAGRRDVLVGGGRILRVDSDIRADES